MRASRRVDGRLGRVALVDEKSNFRLLRPEKSILRYLVLFRPFCCCSRVKPSNVLGLAGLSGREKSKEQKARESKQARSSYTPEALLTDTCKKSHGLYTTCTTQPHAETVSAIQRRQYRSPAHQPDAFRSICVTHASDPSSSWICGIERRLASLLRPFYHSSTVA